MTKSRTKAIRVCLVVVVIIVVRTCYLRTSQEVSIKKDESLRNVTNAYDSYPESRSSFTTEETQWRMKELDRLSKIIQRRLFYVQNPKNCDEAKKVICKFDVKILGYGAGMHDVIFCLLVAYVTNRTLIFNSHRFEYTHRGLESMFLPLSTTCTSVKEKNITYTSDLQNVENIKVIQLPRVHFMKKIPLYLPLSIPEDLGYDMIFAHQNPSIWWIGQFLIFATRYKPDLKQFMEESMQSLGFQNPIVGISVRGAEKLDEADQHGIEEYMSYVQKWYENYEKRYHPVQRRVLLTTDDMAVIKDAKMRYPNYTFITNVEATSAAEKLSTRFTEDGLRGTLLDIELLSRCDYYVGTLSSNFAKIVYYLMHVRYWDAPSRIKSLDVGFTFLLRFLRTPRLYEKYMRALHTENTKHIRVYRNISHYNQATLVCRDNEQMLVPMPTYPEVPVE